jgi:hypothetical protein
VALLRTTKHAFDTHAVLEDPVPGANKIYFQHDAYNSQTLSPLFDKGINHNNTGVAITGLGRSIADRTDNGEARWNGFLLLNGNSVSCLSHWTPSATNNSWHLQIDPVSFLSMDTSRPIRETRYDTLGTRAVAWLGYNKPGFQRLFYSHRLNPVGDLTNNLSTNAVGTARTGESLYPLYVNQSTGNMVCLGMNTSSNYVGWRYGFRITDYFTTSPTFETHATTGQNKTNQFVGVANDGKALFFLNDLTTDYNHIVVKYTDADNTASVLLNVSTAPSAGGTSAGGNRGTSFGNYISKFASSTFADPTSSGNVGWYAPYLDSTGKYHPLWFQWNRSTDVITRNTDITVDWGATNQDAVWSPDIVSGSSVNVNYGMQRLWANETFVSGGTRFLTFMQLHGGNIFDGDAKLRTFVTFTVDPANPKNLTYHSRAIIPSTPKNIVWLNSAETLMGVFGQNNFYIYSFNSSTGWSLIQTLNNQFWGVGTDSLGRIWATDIGNNNYMRIHLITPTVPVTISVVAPQESFNFTGNNITSGLTVNAYDSTGSRIATPVKLVIDGGSMTFPGSALTTTVNTSASADTNVVVTISGGGISNVIASAVI